MIGIDSNVSFGWGELGHQIATRAAAQLLPLHPLLVEESKKSTDRVQAFTDTFYKQRLQLGHVANIPDSHWRSLDENPESKQWGDPSHFFELDKMGLTPLSYGQIPLGYLGAKGFLNKQNIQHFEKAGTLPWRIEQFYELLVDSFQQYPTEDCTSLESQSPHPSLVATSYAGLLTHFVADSTVPLHLTVDFDGQNRNQKGVHSYFESQLVDALEEDLQKNVNRSAKQLVLAKPTVARGLVSLRKKVESRSASEPLHEGAAWAFVLFAETHPFVSVVLDYDKRFSTVSANEKDSPCPPARTMKGPCRRNPTTHVDAKGRKVGPLGGKTVAQWHEALIVEQLALAAVAISDLWARAWLAGGKPVLCHTWKYAHKPSFVSPTDPKCRGYILKDAAKSTPAHKNCLF